MPSFYIPAVISGRTAVLFDPEQVHHLKDVLRSRINDEVTLFDAEGNEFLASISELEKGRVTFSILSRLPARPEKAKLAIACAVPKKAAMEDIVDGLTQLGVDVIIPMQTERVVVRPEDPERRVERWRKIALNAAGQSRRNRLPLITGVMSFREVLATTQEYALKLIPTVGAKKKLREALAGTGPASIAVLVGPEGDFTPGEVEEAVGAGFIPVSLGDTVLRVETAAVAVAAYIRFVQN